MEDSLANTIDTRIRTIAIYDPSGVGPAWIDDEHAFVEAETETRLALSSSADELLGSEALAVLVVLAAEAQQVRDLLVKAESALRGRRVSLVVFGDGQCLADLGSEVEQVHLLRSLTPFTLATAIGSALGRLGDAAGWHKTVDILSSVNQFDQRLVGDAFLYSMVEYLARALDLHCVFIGTADRPDLGLLNAQAVWQGDGHAEGFDFGMQDAACCKLMSENRVTICSEDVQGRYPGDPLAAELQAESSMGAPIVGPCGEVYGALVAYDTKARHDVDVLSAVLEFFAGRTAVELDRQRASDDRYRASHNLEELIAKRTYEVSSVHGELIENAYRSGVAELAVEIIDRISNVLNTIQVSAGRVNEILSGRVLDVLAQANTLVTEHEDDLSAFIENDARGQKLPEIYCFVEDRLKMQLDSVSREIDCILLSADAMERELACRDHMAEELPSLERVRLSPLVRDAVQLQTSALETDGVSVQLQLADLPLVCAYRLQFVQIVSSLLKAARHSLAQDYPSSPRISIETGRSDPYFAYLRISDNGRGFAEEELKAMFRLHSGSGASTGQLCLSQIAGQVRQMGGQVEAQSGGDGKGTTFTVTLPLATTEAEKVIVPN